MKALGAIFAVVVLGVMLITSAVTFYICNNIADKNIAQLYNEKIACESKIPRNQYCKVNYVLTPTDIK